MTSGRRSWTRTRRARMRVVTGLALTSLIGGAVVWLTGPTASASGPGWTSTSDIKWIINSGAITTIDNYAHSKSVTTAAFDNTNTYESGTIASGWTSHPLKVYTSYKTFKAHASSLPKGSWVMYDNEHWPQTPLREQRDPAAYMKDFVITAHAHNLKVILAPAVDLTTDMSCHVSGDKPWKNYLTNCDIPAMVGAAKPDLYEIQAQSFEDNTSATGTNCGCYAWVVSQAAGQARLVTGESSLPILAGLSSNHAGTVSTASHLYLDSEHTRHVVAGYWLNVPKMGKACPKCTKGGAPQVAYNYLHNKLGYSA